MVLELQGKQYIPLFRDTHLISSYGIAPKYLEADGKPRIEVFNPCDDTDDQKTPTAILFTDDYEFLEFGASALQRYAQIIDDGGSALLFQTVIMTSMKCLNE